MRKGWALTQKGQAEHRALAAQLSEELDLPPFAALLALGRGVAEEELPVFLGLEDAEFVNPYDLPDMDEAVERVALALSRGEHITVFGDYDADGVTATALLYSWLSARQKMVSYYLPDRHREGYGMNMEAIDALYERGTKLIVTVDNGTSALREIEHARALGVDVVVTDHHQIGGALPQCHAVVNPHREDCDLPFRDYTGAALAFLLVCALDGSEPAEFLPAYGELLALGTVADVVPLLGDNRAFTRAGLEMLNTQPGIGLAALLRAARVQRRPLGTSALSYTLAPRINAAGRMGLADEALELLLCDDEEKAERLAQKLELYNEERQQTERDITEQALRWMEDHPGRANDRVLVFAGEDWHEGVIGIVASRMVERFGKPCLLLSLQGETAKGSGRSLPGFHLFQAIHNSAHVMQKYGGHELAAGFTLPSAEVDRFREEINTYAAALEGGMPFPAQRLDAKINPARLSAALADEIALLEPFGQGNPQPVFALQRMRLVAATPLSENRHLRLTLEQDGARVTAMAFHTSKEDFLFLPGDEIDLAVTLEANEYMNERSVTLIVKGAKFSALPNEKLLQAQRLVEGVLRREPPEPDLAQLLLPSRENGALVYRVLKKHPDIYQSPERFFLTTELKESQSMARLWLAAEVLRELGVAEADGSGRYRLAPAGEKADWDSAGLVQFLKEASP